MIEQPKRAPEVGARFGWEPAEVPMRAGSEVLHVDLGGAWCAQCLAESRGTRPPRATYRYSLLEIERAGWERAEPGAKVVFSDGKKASGILFRRRLDRNVEIIGTRSGQRLEAANPATPLIVYEPGRGSRGLAIRQLVEISEWAAAGWSVGIILSGFVGSLFMFFWLLRLP